MLGSLEPWGGGRRKTPMEAAEQTKQVSRGKHPPQYPHPLTQHPWDLGAHSIHTLQYTLGVQRPTASTPSKTPLGFGGWEHSWFWISPKPRRWSAAPHTASLAPCYIPEASFPHFPQKPGCCSVTLSYPRSWTRWKRRGTQDTLKGTSLKCKPRNCSLHVTRSGIWTGVISHHCNMCLLISGVCHEHGASCAWS